MTTQNTFDKIANWKQEKLGICDNDIGMNLDFNTKKYKSYINNCEFLETKEWTFSTANNRMITHKMNRAVENSPYMIFKNLRFKNENDANKIKSIEYVIGGTRTDKIYSEIFPQLRKIYNINDDKVIPFHLFIDGMCGLYFHEITINVTLEDNIFEHNITIQYDVHKNLNYNQNIFTKPELKIPTYICECQIGTTQLYPNHNNVQGILLYFNQPTYYMITDNVHKEYKLINHNDDEITLNKDENNIIHLTPSTDISDLTRYGINFSRYSDTLFTFKSPKNEKIKLYSIHWNSLSVVDGCANLSYIY